MRSLREIKAAPTPKPKPIIRGLVNQGELVIVTGQFDSYKSTFGLEMARAVVCGDKFLARFPVQMPGPALVMQKEIHPGFYDERVMELGIQDEAKDRLFTDYSQDFKFKPGYGDVLTEMIHTKGLRLIVFDPLSLFWPFDDKDFNENDNSCVNRALTPLLKLRGHTDCTFVLVHHDPKPSKEYQGRARGASSLMNNPDVRFMIDREDDIITVHSRTRNQIPVRSFQARLDELRHLHCIRNPVETDIHQE